MLDRKKQSNITDNMPTPRTPRTPITRPINRDYLTPAKVLLEQTPEKSKSILENIYNIRDGTKSLDFVKETKKQIEQSIDAYTIQIGMVRKADDNEFIYIDKTKKKLVNELQRTVDEYKEYVKELQEELVKRNKLMAEKTDNSKTTPLDAIRGISNDYRETGNAKYSTKLRMI